MSYNQAYDDASNSPFQQQVTGALIAYATTVATEPSTTTNHVGRLALLTNVFDNLPGYAFKFALICTVNGITWNASPPATDAQVLNIVGTAWTDLSTSSGSLI